MPFKGEIYTHCNFRELNHLISCRYVLHFVIMNIPMGSSALFWVESQLDTEVFNQA